MNNNKTSETISGVMAPYGFNSTGYDNQDRLTAWNRNDGNLDQSWNLSKEGDWNSFTENGTVESRTHSEVHELSTLDSQPVSYDAKGNLTTNQNGQTYSWDFDNRLTSATVPAGSDGIEGTHSYTYDALGRRVSKSVAGADTTVFVCSAQQVVSEYTNAASPTAPTEQYVYATYIDEPVIRDGTGGICISYYHCNQHNSIP